MINKPKEGIMAGKTSSFCSLGGCVEVEFRTSSFCSGGDCVEVAQGPNDVVAVRDTKDRTRELVFTSKEWAAFVAGVKNGEFDTE